MPKFYGELKRFCAELLSSDPSVSADKFTGRIFFNTVLNLLKVVDANGLVKPIKTDETTSFSITNGMAATDITGMTVDSSKYTSMVFRIAINRSTTIMMFQELILHYRNSAWEIHLGDEIGTGDDHGLTFTLSGTTTAQVRVASDSSGAGTLRWKQGVPFDA